MSSPGGGRGWRRGRAIAALLAALCLTGGLGSAAAQEAGEGEPGAAIDVIDLPPLPEMEESVADTTALLAAAGAGEDMITGAAKREQSLGNVASAVTVISGDRLRRMGARTLGEAIATAAGIHLVDDRLSTRVGIRGLQPVGDFNTRILVIIDGTSVTESWSHLSGVGHDVAVSIDEIERIEVIRGPVSSIYGTNAFFGIINVITRGPEEGSRAWARVTAASIGGGSAAAGFALGSLDRQLRGSISATMRRGEELEYEYGQGMVEQLERQRDAGSQVQLALSAAYHGTFAQVRGYLYDRTIPFAPYGSEFDDPYSQTNRQLLLDVGHALQWRGLQLSGRVFGSFYQFDDRATDPEGPALSVVGTARTVGAEVRGRHQLREQLGVTAGLEASYNDTTSESFAEGGPREYAGDLSFGLAGLYVEADSTPARWLGITAGVRLDSHSKFESGVSPRLAAFLTPDDRYGLKLLYAAGFRYPSTYEAKFFDGQDFVAHKDLTKLAPEDIDSVEAILWARPTVTTWLRASAFSWVANNIIKQHPVPNPDDPSMESLRFDNVQRYSSLGVELEASYRDRRGWLAFAGAALVQARVEEGMSEDAAEPGKKARPPGSPWFTASFGISSPRLGDLLHVSSELSVIGGQPTQRPEEEAAPFVGWNAAIYIPSLRGFDLTIGARNLLGVAQEVPAAEDFDRDDMSAGVVPGEGRELYVRLGHALF